MAELPTGTVTFLFTDIEGSTVLWEQQRDAMRQALVRHDALVEQIVAEHDGQVVRPRGEGDSRFAVFSRATDAVAAAAALQQALHTEPWTIPTPLRVRMAIHTGEADLREGDYYGSAVNRCARLRAVAHGGQTLVSLATEQLVRGQLASGVRLHDLGEHRLKDLQHPERVFALVDNGVSADFPPLKALDARPNNLPVQLTSFIGREQEVAALCARLRDPQVHLVTLTAAGGSGKTRLAVQAAAELIDDFPDGVWFVDLAPITVPDLVASTIAQTLGIKDVAGQSIAEALRASLRQRHLLLVLDNFEQVVGAAPLVTDLLKAAPRLTVLATSREVLHLSGEHEVPVPPLAVPNPALLPPLEHLAQYEAVRLFRERAQAVKPEFQVTNANASAVAEICHRLDGLPLALELAAARVKLFSPQALLVRLDQRLKTLVGGARDLPTRQQTLRGAIDWSYNLLPAAEQRLFTLLAVFVGGSTLEAVEVVGNAAGDLDVLDAVASLVDKSLLRQVDMVAGEPRFTMFETIHEYALEQFEASGEGAAVRAGHAAYFLALAEAAEAPLRGADQHAWLEQLEVEYDNLRAALLWAQSSGAWNILGRLVAALGRFWYLLGPWTEGKHWFDVAHRVASGLPSAPERDRWWAAVLFDRALIAAGEQDVRHEAELAEQCLMLARGSKDRRGEAAALVLAGQGAAADLPRAQALLREAIALAREVGDPWLLVLALNSLGFLQDPVVDAESGALFAESLPLARATGDPWLIGDTLGLLGMWFSRFQGDAARARPLLEEALAIHRAAGSAYGIAGALYWLAEIDRAGHNYAAARVRHAERLQLEQRLGSLTGIANALGNLAVVTAGGGNHAQARELMAEAVALVRQWGQPRHIAGYLNVQGEIELEAGDVERAAAIFEEASSLAQQAGQPDLIGWGFVHLGHVAHRQQAAARAAQCFRKGLTVFRGLEDQFGVAACLVGLAEVCRVYGRLSPAARLLGAAEALDERPGHPLGREQPFERDRVVAALREQLDDGQLSAAWAEGRAMTLEQAIAYALNDQSA